MYLQKQCTGDSMRRSKEWSWITRGTYLFGKEFPTTWIQPSKMKTERLILFKDEKFWLFDDLSMSVAESYPKKIREYWMTCPKLHMSQGPKNSSTKATATSQSNSISNMDSLFLLFILIHSLLLPSTFSYFADPSVKYSER